MSYINCSHGGQAIGDFYMSGAGVAGQLVSVSADNTVAVNTDPTVRSLGILAKDAADGELCVIYSGGGIIETDQYEGTINAGDELKINASGKLIAAGSLGADERVVGHAISVVGGILRYRSDV